MSNLHLPRPALAALVIAPLSATLACASRRANTEGPADGSPAPARSAPAPEVVADTSSVAIGGAKTIERLLTGRFPGVNVAQVPGGGLQIRIRGGGGTFMAGEEPLYIVDGTPMASGTGGIVHLNPYDIEKIEVLKNPADIGVYGIRGSNGVIRITTIRPGRR